MNLPIYDLVCLHHLHSKLFSLLKMALLSIHSCEFSDICQRVRMILAELSIPYLYY